MTEKLVIKRSEWRRGKGAVDSYLYHEKENGECERCCLGFYGNLLGISDDQMHDEMAPSNMDHQRYPWPTDFGKLRVDARDAARADVQFGLTAQGVNRNNLEAVLMGVNDTQLLPEEQRERWLTRLFKKYLDVEVEFVP